MGNTGIQKFDEIFLSLFELRNFDIPIQLKYN